MGKAFSHPTHTFLLLGLDKSGKSTILYRLKRGTFTLCQQPTMGFNTERVPYPHRKAVVQFWDLGGMESVRAIWPKYLRDCDALLFVVDATDRRRLDEVGAELNGALVHLSRGKETPIYILLNKSDMPNSMNVEDVSRHLELPELQKAGYCVQMTCTCGVTGEGLEEVISNVFDNLNTIKLRQKQRTLMNRNSLRKSRGHPLAKFAR